MTIETQNKSIVLEAFDKLLNKRDYVAAEAYWPPAYIQHSALIAPGRQGLFDLIKSLPDTLRAHFHLDLNSAVTHRNCNECIASRASLKTNKE